MHACLSPELILELAGRGDVRQFARGSVIIREGERSQSLFILLEGQLSVFSQGERGRKVIYNTLGPGEIVGEMFLDGGLRSASVQAVTAAECIEVREFEILAFMHSCPEFSVALAKKLTGRLRRATAQVRSIALEGVFLRTVAELGALAVVESDCHYLPASITQAQIASRIGATREMVNHVFRELHKGGFLVRERRGRWRVLMPLPTKRQ